MAHRFTTFEQCWNTVTCSNRKTATHNDKNPPVGGNPHGRQGVNLTQQLIVTPKCGGGAAKRFRNANQG